MKNRNNIPTFSGRKNLNQVENINIKNHDNLHTFNNKNQSNTGKSGTNSKTPNRKRNSKTPEKEKKSKSLGRNDITNDKENQQNIDPRNNQVLNLASDLLFNINDDFKTLIYKNTKLRELIVKSNETINHLEFVYEELKVSSDQEKMEMINQLDKISSNYKLYSDYYGKYFEIADKLKTLDKDYKHNIKVMNTFKDNMKKIVHENLDVYSFLIEFIMSISFIDSNLTSERIVEMTESNTQKIFQFLIGFKDKFNNNLKECKNLMDRMNFPEIWNLLRDSIQNSQFKISARYSLKDNPLTNSRAKNKINQNNINRKSLKENDSKKKFNTIDIKSEENIVKYNFSPEPFKKLGNNQSQRNIDNQKKTNNSILLHYQSKSHSADNFFPNTNYNYTNSNNKSFPKNPIRYSFRNINSERLNYSENNEISSKNIQKYTTNESIQKLENFNAKLIYPNEEEEIIPEQHVNLSGLFYNERFSHYEKAKKIHNKQSPDDKNSNTSYIEQSKNKKTSIKKTDNKNSVLNNVNCNEVIMEDPSPQKTNEHKNEFSRDSLTENNIKVRACYEKINDQQEIIYDTNRNNFDNDYFNNLNLNNNHLGYCDKNYFRDSLISNNPSLNNENLFRSNSNNENLKNPKQNLHQSNRLKNDSFNSNRDLYQNILYEQNKNIDFKNKALRENNHKEEIETLNKDKKYNPIQAQQNFYRAILKNDLYIESLKMNFPKNSIIDVIFIGKSPENQMVSSDINHKEIKDKFVPQCFLIFDGSHYPISRDIVEIIREQNK